MYSQRYYKDGRIPLLEFDIWFRHHLRQIRLSNDEYAALHNVTPCVLDAICTGSELPTGSMLDEMGLRYIHVDDDRGWYEDV